MLSQAQPEGLLSPRPSGASRGCGLPRRRLPCEDPFWEPAPRLGRCGWLAAQEQELVGTVHVGKDPGSRAHRGRGDAGRSPEVFPKGRAAPLLPESTGRPDHVPQPISTNLVFSGNPPDIHMERTASVVFLLLSDLLFYAVCVFIPVSVRHWGEGAIFRLQLGISGNRAGGRGLSMLGCCLSWGRKSNHWTAAGFRLLNVGDLKDMAP